MILYFGLKLDKLVYPKSYEIQNELTSSIQICGPSLLLEVLEQQLGIPYDSTDIEYLRIEQYRQALARLSNKNPDNYYAASFRADEFATAAFLLARRDELALAGWDFNLEQSIPKRLQVFAKIEELFHHAPQPLVSGYADRFITILDVLESSKLPIRQVYLNEPFELLPFHIQYLFNILKEKGININPISIEKLKGTTDLATFSRILANRAGKKKKIAPLADKSLIILKAKRETDAAAYLSKLLELNPLYQPACIIPEQNRTLDNAIIMEGLPSMGILSASLARPTLQILKLVSTFLWNPIDPIKILEFVSLAVKPLHQELSNIIAEEIARSPGINSDRWRGVIYRFFQNLEKRATTDKSINVRGIRFQYDFWFQRKRYDINSQAPKDDAIQIFHYLTTWAKKTFDEGGKKEQSLLTLSSQAKKVRELLTLLPPSETHLTSLQLERIVRTIYEPAPIQFTETQVGSLSYVHEPSAIIFPSQELLWWNFHDSDQEHHFPKWYKEEMDYLEQLGIRLETPERENQRTLWQCQRPFHLARKQLILVLLERVDGSEVLPHPLFGDLQATFSDLEPITFDIHKKDNLSIMEEFHLPGQVQLEGKQSKSPKPYLHIDLTERLTERENESFSSLNDLFYYPYKWVFKHKINLRKSSILSVVQERTMFGNLAHRLFEMMFSKHDLLEWDQVKINNYIDEKINPLLESEGSLLLMYGREPDKVNFQNKVKFAAFSLVEQIRNNGWIIRGTEQPLKGSFLNIPITGIADLVLERGTERAIVDFKWRNSTFRVLQIKNNEDLQLVLYSKLLDNDDSWAHTAYFIIETGRIIARNDLAFKEANAISPDDDHRAINQQIWDKMEKTYQWRMEQIKSGKIEIRTEKTAEILEEEGLPVGDFMDFLSMPMKDAAFNDYEILIKG